MSKKIDKSLILNKIKSNYKFTKDIDFANFLGIKPQTLSSWYSRNSFDHELIYLKCPGINANWLITGRGSMFEKGEEGNTLQHDPKLNQVVVNNLIPLVNPSTFSNTSSTVFPIDDIDIQSRFFVPDFTGADFMVRVSGDSMYPRYSSGDIAACKIIKEKNFIQWNKVHVIFTKTQGTLIKRIKKVDNEHIQAVSENESYDPFEIPLQEINGIAIIIGVIKLE